ncbi:MAG: hypothetical protein ACOZAL_00340 [Patescibacteria group bacterium]
MREVKRVLMVLLSILMLLLFCSCGKITQPDKPWEYKTNVQITYSRDVSKITNPEGPDEGTILFGELNDPQIPGGQDHISIQMTKVMENRFSCTIPKIWINSSSIYHVVRVQDLKLAIPGGTPDTNHSGYTGENIDIPGSYDRRVVPIYNGESSELWFMIK